MSSLWEMILEPFLWITIYALVDALIVQFACKIKAGFKPGYANAYKASFLVGLIDHISFLVLPSGADGSDLSEFMIEGILLLVLSLIYQTIVYFYLVKNPQGDSMGIRNAFVVAIIQIAIGTTLFVIGLNLIKITGLSLFG